ncbi:hypothetical protein PROFUN_13422 [Planoprotostelium fungivorum]|uniref:Uncharacterized protein n=1 Tax=Planoprotostelium fungivorum TaxID=1890364 RepID=A0A2P6N414_9EUKA|nr:hypothetical protein PROFUN_13422 [Planoprotostelium fungivorum]
MEESRETTETTQSSGDPTERSQQHGRATSCFEFCVDKPGARVAERCATRPCLVAVSPPAQLFLQWSICSEIDQVAIPSNRICNRLLLGFRLVDLPVSDCRYLSRYLQIESYAQIHQILCSNSHQMIETKILKYDLQEQPSCGHNKYIRYQQYISDTILYQEYSHLTTSNIAISVSESILRTLNGSGVITNHGNGMMQQFGDLNKYSIL